MIGVLFASLCGIAVTFVLLVVLPNEEVSDGEDSLRNVVSIAAHPLPPVRKREANRAAHHRNRTSRMAQMYGA